MAVPMRGDNPFPGLRPFRKEEADLFFGRDQQSDELVRRLSRGRFLAIVGTSGSGKSSLLGAGLLPSLESGFLAEAGAHWRTTIIRPQDDPIGFLSEGLVVTGALSAANLERSAAEGVVETTLRRSSLGLVEAARLAPLAPRENLLVVVDQFEEIFRFADLARRRGAGDEAPAFVKLLLEATWQTEVPIYVVIAMRSDFLGDCARFRHLPETISNSQYLIPRLSRDELQAVIAGPIGVRGGRIAPNAVQHLLNEIGDDMDQLPVLQHTLMRAWAHWEQSHSNSRGIDLADIEAIGGMSEALSRHADEAFAELETERDRTIAERLFKCLTERGPDNREVRRPTTLSRIEAIAGASAADVIRVIDVFRTSGRSFLMPPHEFALNDDSVIDISHESLIRQWTRLRGWVEQESESRATYLRLVEAARLHHAGKAGVWGEPDLTYARIWQDRELPNAAWAERYGPGFTEASAFLRESEDAQAAALEDKRQREEAVALARERELIQAKALAEAERQRAEAERLRAEDGVNNERRLKKLLWTAVSAAAVALGFALLAIVAYFRMQSARDASVQQSIVADVQRLATVSTSVGSQYPQRALLLAAEAVSATKSAVLNNSAFQLPDAEQALRDVVRTSSGVALDGLSGGYSPMTVSPDGRWFVVGGETGRISLIDLRANDPSRSTNVLRGHDDRVSSMAIGSDSRWLVTGSTDRTARVWDLHNPKPGADAIVLREHRGSVTAVAISGDQRWIATGSDDTTVRLWSPSGGDPARSAVELRGHRTEITSIAFTPDTRWIATGSGVWRGFDSGELRLWDLRASDPSSQSVILLNGVDRVESVTVSPGGNWLLAWTRSASYLWDLRRDRPSDTQRVVGAYAVISPDDRWVVSSGGFGGDTHLSSLSEPDVRTPAAGVPTLSGMVLKGHNLQPSSGGVRSFAFSGNGRWLATTGDDDPNVLLWDVTAAEPSRQSITLRGHKHDVWGLAISADSRWLVTTARGEAAPLVWDLRAADPSVSPIALRGLEADAWQLLFSPDDRWLIARGLSEDYAHLWDASRGPAFAPEVVAREKIGSGVNARIKAVVSPDTRWLATSGHYGIRLWNVSAQPAAAEPLTLEHEGETWSMAFSMDSRWLFAGDRKGMTRLWDLRNGQTKPARVFRGHSNIVRTLAVSADNRWLATGSDDQTVRLWDLSAPVPEAASILVHRHGRWVEFLAFSPDNRWLVSIDLGGQTRLVDLSVLDAQNPAKASQELKGHPDIASVAFSAESRWLATGNKNGTANLWDLRNAGTPRTPLVLDAHAGSVEAVAFSGRWLVTACGRRQEPSGGMVALYPGDRTARLWDLTAADPSASSLVLRGHDDDLASVGVSANGRWLVTGSREGVTRVWDLLAPSPSQSSIVLRGHAGPVVSVAAAPDNHSLLTWSEDGTARRWILDQQELLAQARRLAGRNLTHREWHQYFPGRLYRKTFDELPIHPTVIGDFVAAVPRVGVEAALQILPSALHDEAKQAAIDVLGDQAKAVATKGDADAALAFVKTARSIQPGLDDSFTDAIKRVAAVALVKRGKEAITEWSIPNVDLATTSFRKAQELDPQLRANPDLEVRQQASRRFVELARQTLASPIASMPALDESEKLVEAALKLNPELQGMSELATLRSRNAIDRRDLARRLAERKTTEDAAKEWDALLEAGRAKDAIASYARFESANPAITIPATNWNRLCWFGAIHGSPREVLPACDRAVSMETKEPAYRDSRGLARALTGDRQGAIADWQYYVKNVQTQNDKTLLDQRRKWVASLQAGKPFVLTEDLRKSLLAQ